MFDRESNARRFLHYRRTGATDGREGCSCRSCEQAAVDLYPGELAAIEAAAGRAVSGPLAIAAEATADADAAKVAAWRPAWAVLGVDLGKRTDHSAWCLLTPRHPADPPDVEHRVPELRRLPLGMSYVDQMRDLTRFAEVTVPKLDGRLCLAFDATGVGDAVAEMMTAGPGQVAGVDLAPFKLTGGDSWSRVGSTWRVSKVSLIAAAQVALEQQSVIIGEAGHAEVLVRELRAYRLKPSSVEGGADRLEAERQSDHDDLVVAFAAACWFGREAAAPPVQAWSAAGVRLGSALDFGSGRRLFGT
jgi:hypothetical protein